VVLAQAVGIVGRPADGFPGQLEEAGIELPHHSDQPPDLGPAGEPARHRPAVGGLVARRARGGEADGARADRVAQLTLHRLEIVFVGRLLEGALAHHIRAQRRMADVPGVIDALGQGFQAVEEFRERRPLPLDAGVHGFRRDVLGPLEVANDHVTVGGRAGGEREAAVAHHDAGDAVPARAGPEGIPEDLSIHVGVAVHETRRHHLAVGIEHLSGRLTDPTDGGDSTMPHADVGPVARQAGAIDDHAVLDDQVVLHGSHLSVASECVGIVLQRRRFGDRLGAVRQGDASPRLV
jgi:hypothetical protein